MSSVQRVAPFESRVAVGLGGGLLGFTFTVLGLLFLISAQLDGFLVVAFLVPVLLAASWPAFTRQARRERDPSLVTLLVTALLLKLFGSLVRYWVAVAFYDSNADAFEYHRVGVDLAMRFRAGNFDTGLASLSGTDFISFFTGIVYTITGPSIFAGFLLYSWLAFGGMFYMYRAFTIAVPDGNKRSYARLLFFMPSMLYWPSSIGKEAWMLFTLGIAAWGAALVLRYRSRGYVVLGLGLAGTAAVRPHITLLLFVALFIAYLWRRRSWLESRSGLLGRMAGIGLMVLVGGLVLTQAADFFHLQDLDPAGVQQVLDRTQDQSSKGASQFSVSRPKSPGEYPDAVLTVLFRPYPWEAGNAQALVASVEGTLLALLFVVSLPRLARLPRLLVSTPYLLFAVAYILMFVFAFSSVGNFGIITRQRTQVFPFVLVLLALPLPVRERESEKLAAVAPPA